MACDDGAMTHPARSPGISIQCSTGPFWALQLELTFDALAEAGFEEVELMVTGDPETQEPEVPLRLARERGLRIVSVHGPFLVLTKGVWGFDPLEKIRRGTEMCSAFGAQTLIVHPPYLWEQGFASWLRTEAERHAEETGVRVAVETMYPKWIGNRRLRAYRWLDPRDLFTECHHLALDTSHLTVAREDIFDAYRLLLPKLVHIHLSNNADDGRDGHLEMTEGVLPLERFLREVAMSGYAGAVSLELTVRGYGDRPEALAAMLRRNRIFIEEGLGHAAGLEKDLPRI
jgi:sugar phosphate isomerase/epimerase